LSKVSPLERGADANDRIADSTDSDWSGSSSREKSSDQFVDAIEVATDLS